jgi:hypothetical protein
LEHAAVRRRPVQLERNPLAQAPNELRETNSLGTTDLARTAGQAPPHADSVAADLVFEVLGRDEAR